MQLINIGVHTEQSTCIGVLCRLCKVEYVKTALPSHGARVL